MKIAAVLSAIFVFMKVKNMLMPKKSAVVAPSNTNASQAVQSVGGAAASLKQPLLPAGKGRTSMQEEPDRVINQEINLS